MTMLPLAKLPKPPPVLVTVVTLLPKGVPNGWVAIGGNDVIPTNVRAASKTNPSWTPAVKGPGAELLVVVIVAVPVKVALSGGGGSGGGGVLARQSAS